MRGRTLIGERLGPFKIEGLIGEGATSEVYAAVDERLDRGIALKILPRHFAKSADVRQRFAAESRLASRLNHPHVVPIYEADEIDGLLYISMLRVDGSDLGHLLAAKGPLSPSRTVRIVGQAASALGAAHATGLIHRDVKPQNILVARTEGGTDHVFLTDFGLTKVIGSASRHTQTGQIVGTVHYMSPEQIEGRDVTHLSDVYSLGCVLFECLTGRTPFERDSDLAVLWAHVNADVPVTSEVGGAARSLDAVIGRALAKAPEDRYQSCGELARGMRAALRRRHLPAPRGPSTPASYTRRITPDDLTPKPGRASFTDALKTLVFTSVVIGLMAMAVVGFARMTDMWSPGGSVADGEPSRLGGSSAAQEVRGGRRADPVARDDKRSSRASGDRDDASLEVAAPAAGDFDTPYENTFDPGSGAIPGSDVPQRISRTATRSYNAASLDGYGQDCVGNNVGCVEFIALPGERFVSISLDDSSGQTVRAWLKRDFDADGVIDGDWVEVCGRTSMPVRVSPGTVVKIQLQRGECGSVESTPTTGIVTAVFSNRA